MTLDDDERKLRALFARQPVTGAEARAVAQVRSRAASLGAESPHHPARLRGALALGVMVAMLGAVAAVAISVHIGSRASGGVAGTGPSATAQATSGATPGPGAWQVATVPGILGLTGVSCVSSADCWAVGGSTIERYSGSAWTAVSNPTPVTGEISSAGLVSDACVAADDCWAVGSVGILGGSASAPLIEHYDGAAWTIATGPATPAEVAGDGISLDAVTCVSAADCWAVGQDRRDGGSDVQPLVVAYDGTSWNLVATPSLSGAYNLLEAISCPGPADCWAVGQAGSAPLIEHLAGTRWSIAASPQGVSALAAVTCVDADECWAVGDTSVTNSQPAIAKYSGGAWTVVPSPQVDGTFGAGVDGAGLDGIACTSAGSCWAVGNTVGGPGWTPGAAHAEPAYPLIERYSAGEWTVESGPTLVATGGELRAVACAPAGVCSAVGNTGYPPETAGLIATGS
jgi:hypothetical protein